ncbi:thiamine pyrophosphate enzyme, central domain protein [Paraburkholderia xenovorans LB400]|uniref:Acetolactate synthase large subunit n=1 Tax=Paraburkholderia xenovorans (strain LB400) TaxID=266265 RepID=Q13M49_PARXL|nr:thiamine pyrophosphate-dependent enzyme [Paraburkholderia xenovorans]ABE34840.1 Putative acetolactate synthase large subunit [Paraburkholderia xenovorans LB400]AIP35214.1 thiamine pyrophosphate enzyme, central domain protein [Paraburkholderia xenovorans LB400]
MSREHTAGAVDPSAATRAGASADGNVDRVSGARIVAEVLGAYGVLAVTFIPGEGILEIVDALAVHAPQIALASFRHEAGMTYAAQAIGQLSGQPGVCLAARAPGALNTALAVHTAFTDSAPMILIVGQASQAISGREAMLNVDDYQRVFGPLAKWVGVIDAPGRIGEMFARAWHVAMSGRRGPVVLVMPEDVAQAHARLSIPALPQLPAPSIARTDLDRLRGMLQAARRPMIIAGGTGWQRASLEALAALARQHVVPVATTYRRRDLIDHDDAVFVGEIGIGIDPSLGKRVGEADLLIVLNGRLGELNTLGEGFKGYALIEPDATQRGNAQRLVHIHADASELNAVYQADLALLAQANAAVDAWQEASATGATWADAEALDARRQWMSVLRAERLAFVTGGRCEGPLDLRAVYATLDAALEDDAVVTSGAGAYAIWPQRYLTHRRPGTQLGPKSGAMGYGLAAAIGAALVLEPGRQIVAIAGDGCLMMHAEELETAVRLGTSLLVLVVNNRAYGAIDGAQRRLFGRTVGTELGNIDFAAFASAFGVKSWVVDETAAFAPALDQALAASGVRLIELRVPRSVGKPLA